MAASKSRSFVGRSFFALGLGVEKVAFLYFIDPLLSNDVHSSSSSPSPLFWVGGKPIIKRCHCFEKKYRSNRKQMAEFWVKTGTIHFKTGRDINSTRIRLDSIQKRSIST